MIENIKKSYQYAQIVKIKHQIISHIITSIENIIIFTWLCNYRGTLKIIIKLFLGKQMKHN